MLNMVASIQKIEIPKEEVVSIGYNFDELGKVFIWNNRIYRMIYPEKKEIVNKLLSSGLIQKLSDKGLFPETTLTNYRLDNSDMILEHEKINPLIYPSNWSFDMIKDAALCILEVNLIAQKYGYQTMDSHGFNILFKSGRPVFIDLGSFISNSENPKGWKAYEEFVRYFLYPLNLFKSGNFFLGRAAMTQGKSFINHSSYKKYKHPIYRLVASDKIDKWYEAFYKFKAFSHYGLSEIEERAPKPLLPLLKTLKKNKIALFQKVNFSREIRRVQRIKLPKFQSQWGYYHDQFVEKDGKITAPTPRFNRIIEIIKELKPSSTIEIGGNQGVFSELIAQETSVKQLICTDYDEIAVNKMYERFKTKQLNITPSLLDVINPSNVDYGAPIEERYQSDMVIALAIIHHLVLTQKVPLKDIFNQFSKFSSRFVITEFMPLGLYSETAKHNPKPPTWYTEDWFQKEFEKSFILLKKEKLEKNRVLFVGEKK